MGGKLSKYRFGAETIYKIMTARFILRSHIESWGDRGLPKGDQ